MVMAARIGALLVIACAAKVARADGNQEKSRAEHSIVVGAGGATEIDLAGGGATPGAAGFVEWEAIEDWLELELGMSVLAADGGVEVPAELILKKPFELGATAELMVGAGPEVVRTFGHSARTCVGGAVALDFMVWPWGRRLGAWIEPEYDVVSRDGVSQGLGVTSGLMMGF